MTPRNKHMQLAAPIRSGVRRVRRRSGAAAMIVALGLAPVAAMSWHPSPVQAAVRVPVAQVTPNVAVMTAGSTADLTVQFASIRPAALTWSVNGRPAGVTATIRCTSTRVCVVTLQASASAPTSTALVEIILRSGSSTRLLPVALHIDALLPVTTVPITPVPTTVPVTAPRNLSLRPVNLIATVRPGARATFGINIVRDGWTDAVNLSVDTLPVGWRAAYLPNPVIGSTATLIIDTPATATAGDYPIRISGSAGSTRAESLLVVRLRAPELAATVLGVGAPVVAGATTRYLLDVRSIDDPALPVAIRAEGLPAGSFVVYSANPAIGTVTADVTVPTGTSAVVFAFFFVVSRDGTELRVPTTLTVVSPTIGFFRFFPTAVPPVAGDGRGYGLSSASNLLSVARGATVSVDVLVSPKGGFNDPIDFSLTSPTGWSVLWSVIGTNIFRVTAGPPTASATGPAPLVLNSASGSLAASIAFTAMVS
jgi:hypothetical protein